MPAYHKPLRLIFATQRKLKAGRFPDIEYPPRFGLGNGVFVGNHAKQAAARCKSMVQPAGIMLSDSIIIKYHH
jgi:hypothetical protein